MFGQDPRRTTRSASHEIEALIGPKVEIKGDLLFSGGLFVEGRVIGAVVADETDAGATVTVAQDGRIQGEIHAPQVIISGEVDGNIHASGQIELNASARIRGDLHYRVISMAAGAMVTGRMIHIDAEQASISGPRALPRPELVADQDAA